MEPSDYVTALRRDGARLAEAGSRALDRTVPSCPEWDGAELLWHTGVVLDFWTRITDGRTTSLDDHQLPTRPPTGELPDWVAVLTESTAATLEAADPRQPCWTWAEQQDVGFVQRRCAQEVGMHRWDAANATGRHPEPIEHALALDGLDDYLTNFRFPEPPPGHPGLHLAPSDSPDQWLLQPSDGSWQLTREQPDGPATTLRGPASDLLLVLWHRRPLHTVTATGDPAAALAAFRQV